MLQHSVLQQESSDGHLANKTTKPAQRAAVFLTRTSWFEGEPRQQDNCQSLRADRCTRHSVMTFLTAQREKERQLARARTIAGQYKPRRHPKCTPGIASIR
jgi:hypothetical protein